MPRTVAATVAVLLVGVSLVTLPAGASILEEAGAADCDIEEDRSLTTEAEAWVCLDYRDNGCEALMLAGVSGDGPGMPYSYHLAVDGEDVDDDETDTREGPLHEDLSYSEGVAEGTTVTAFAEIDNGWSPRYVAMGALDSASASAAMTC